MSQPNIFGGLIQGPNMSKHISRNKGTTIKASKKPSSQQQVFFGGGGKKNHFFL